MTIPDINDVMRAMFGALARWYQDTNGTLTTAGSSNAFTLAANNTHAALVDQSILVCRADRAPTGAATLQVGSLAAKSIKVNHDEDVTSSTWEANQMLVFIYNANDGVYELIGPSIAQDGSITTAKLADGAVTTAKVTSVPFPRGYIGGLTTSNGTDADHDIDIAVGVARDSSNAFNFTISSTHTKRIDASWASGSGNGGLASAVSLSNATTYHLFLVDDGSDNTEAGFDTSLTAANLLSDTGGSYYRRIASFVTDGSANLQAFTQIGDVFRLSTPVEDVSTGSLGASETTFTLSSLPSGLVLQTRLNALANHATGAHVYIKATADADLAPSTSAAPDASISPLNGIITGQIDVWADTSRQITARSTAATTTLRASLLQWTDLRGRYD